MAIVTVYRYIVSFQSDRAPERSPGSILQGIVMARGHRRCRSGADEVCEDEASSRSSLQKF